MVSEKSLMSHLKMEFTKMASEKLFTNHLINETSPYLLQHAHNPVNWYPWGDEVLKKAKDENKMLLISIGYAACHWCHVMEHECFEDPEVAGLMNESFICIKVDREERPDVDQVYMTAVQIISGNGGWPLNALAMPDGRPFYAGTYFPKKDWIKMLSYFVEIQKNNPASLALQAENVTKGIHSSDNIEFNHDNSLLEIHDLDEVFNSWKSNIDFTRGGSNKAPKFPMPSNWEYLLHYNFISKNQDALNAVTKTLDNMARGGIYDQTWGGFSRYSTDEDWHVPHFEKMLYDNAQLVCLYSHAFQLTKNPLYRKVVYETLHFIERELTSPENGFYSSLDADSEGEEGKFYVWTKKEIDDALAENSQVFNDYYDISQNGNWEMGKNILRCLQSDEIIARNHKLSVSDLHTIINKGNNALLLLRNQRIRPGLDDKILTSWNALMIKAYATAYRVFAMEQFLESALNNAVFLLENAIDKDNKVNRNYKNGKSSIPGLLDDYAFTISAFIDLYQATFDEKWIYKANDLAEYSIKHFFDSVSGMFYYTHNLHANLISRKMEVSDNVIPASNSEMAKNLFALGKYLDKEEYIKMARQMLVNVQNNMLQYMPYYSNWGILELNFISPPFEIVISGDDCTNSRQFMDQNYLPNVFFSGGEKEGTLPLLQNKLIPGRTTIYVCRNKTCKMPVTDAGMALEQLK